MLFTGPYISNRRRENESHNKFVSIYNKNIYFYIDYRHKYVNFPQKPLQGFFRYYQSGFGYHLNGNDKLEDYSQQRKYSY